MSTPEIVDQSTHRTTNTKALILQLQGEEEFRTSAQSKIFLHALIVRTQLVTLIHSISSKEVKIITWKLENPLPPGKTWACVSPKGEWSILTENGSMVSSFGVSHGYRADEVVGIHNAGRYWNRSTKRGGKSLSREERFCGGQHILQLQNCPYIPPALSGGVLLEGGMDGRWRMPMWTQEKMGDPVLWWRFNGKTDRVPTLYRTIAVGEGRILHDVHPTLEAFIVENTLTDLNVLEAYGDGWSMTLYSRTYCWRRLSPLPRETRSSATFEDAWGRRIYATSSNSGGSTVTHVDFFQDYGG